MKTSTKQKSKVWAVDFDGTLCESVWPGIGKPNMKTIEQLKNVRKNGDKLILWTCREGERLNEAVEWCKRYGLEFDEVNNNLPEAKEKWQNDPRKISADYYLDDKNITYPDVGDLIVRLRDELMQDSDLYNGFVASIASALKDSNAFPFEPEEEVAEHILNRMIGIN